MIEPKLRFKADDGSQFPDWEKKKLEDVVEFLDGQRKPLEAGQRVSGKYPYYGASGIIDYVEDYIFDEELILLSEDGANILDRNYRVCFLAKGKYWVNNHAHVLRAMDGNVNGFICEQLETFDYRKYNSGGAQPKLNQATCRAIIMNMPSLPEQQKIAEFLSTIDTVIKKQKETVSAWEERKKGVMQKLFSQEVRFKADDGSEFPDWEEKKLGECGRFYTGVGFSEKYQGHKGLDVDVYKVSDMNIVGNEKYMTLSNNTVDDSIVRQMKTKVITSKCLVFAKVGAAIYGERKRITTKPFLIDNNMMAFEPYSCLNIEYLHSWSCSVKFSQYAQVGALPSYNSSDIGIIKIHIPCLAEQQKIADCLSSLDEVIEKQKATLAAWEELKKGLLQQMFV